MEGRRRKVTNIEVIRKVEEKRRELMENSKEVHKNKRYKGKKEKEN